jgi:hypothetical protein
MRFEQNALRALAVIVASVAVIAGVAAAATPSSDDPRDAIISALRERLAVTSGLVSVTEFIPPSRIRAAAINCSCADYCLGNCFAPLCAPCAAALFSGVRELCFAPGPLGTGLLCRVDPATGRVSANACCNAKGPTCWLPPGSCCENGGCSRCPKQPRGAEGGALPSDAIFPSLECNATRNPRSSCRRFDNSTGRCIAETPRR